MHVENLGSAIATEPQHSWPEKKTWHMTIQSSLQPDVTNTGSVNWRSTSCIALAEVGGAG